jgi:hypothetical protein
MVRVEINIEGTLFICDTAQEAVELMLLMNKSKKSIHAVILGRKGGLKGGKARAASLTKEQLSKIGKAGAKARWNKK